MSGFVVGAIALLLMPLASRRNRFRLRTMWRGWRRYRAAGAWLNRGRFNEKHQERFRRAEARHTEALLAERELRAGAPDDIPDLTP